MNKDVSASAGLLVNQNHKTLATETMTSILSQTLPGTSSSLANHETKNPTGTANTSTIRVNTQLVKDKFPSLFV